MAELNSSPEQTTAKKPRKKLNARVDLTAMVDLAFLLITFFMLTTSLQKPKMFGVVMPSDGPPGPAKASHTMTICLGKNNQVLSYLGLPDAPLTPLKITSDNGKDGLRQNIVEIKQRVEKDGSSLLVIIKASDHSVYANLVNVLDEVNIAGGNPTYAISAIEPKDVDMLKQRNAY